MKSDLIELINKIDDIENGFHRSDKYGYDGLKLIFDDENFLFGEKNYKLNCIGLIKI